MRVLNLLAATFATLLGTAVHAAAIPAPAVDTPKAASPGSQTAVFAGGCFWGVEAVFRHMKGVQSSISGYAGGRTKNPTYQDVSSGMTGHAEAVEVKYDPSQVTYGELLRVFMSVAHDPTELNRQGPDVGPQYRSAIFTQDAEQKRVAEAYIAQLDKTGVYKKPIVTQVNGADSFYAAEAYHQDYATLHPRQPYIIFHDQPKIDALKKLFPERAREKPVLLSAAGG